MYQQVGKKYATSSFVLLSPRRTSEDCSLPVIRYPITSTHYNPENTCPVFLMKCLSSSISVHILPTVCVTNTTYLSGNKYFNCSTQALWLWCDCCNISASDSGTMSCLLSPIPLAIDLHTSPSPTSVSSLSQNQIWDHQFHVPLRS